MSRIVVFISLFIFHHYLGAQENFQRIYVLEDTSSIIHDIYVTDSLYYFGASAGRGNQRCDVVFGKISKTGEIIEMTRDYLPSEFNKSYSDRTQLDTNFRGNFIFGYANIQFGIPYMQPKITEFSKEGVVQNHLYFDFLSSDSLKIGTYGKVLVHNPDSSYYMAFSYYDFTTDDNTFHEGGEAGALLVKTGYDGSIHWMKRFRHLPLGLNKPGWIVRDIIYLNDEQILLTCLEYKIHAPASGELDWAKIHFLILDLQGNTISHKTFQDTQDCWSGRAFLPLENGDMIISYRESALHGTPPNMDYFNYRGCLARVNPQMQLIWKDTLRSYFNNYADYSLPDRLHLVNDSIFAGAFTWSYITMYDSSIWNTVRNYKTVRVFNRHINGQRIWERDYLYWTPTDSINEPEYWMNDFELTPDGGFITCGSVKHSDSLNAGKIGQFAYILKTNCLGFLGEPEAAVSYTFGDDFSVIFQNESIQSGSFIWDFGDGMYAQTDEKNRTITHTYSSDGNYTIQLIAQGCNGEADTLYFEIEVPTHEDTTDYYVGDGTLLTLFPNPLISGESLAFFVGDITHTVVFDIHNQQGQLIFTETIQKGYATYISPLFLSSGMYHCSLRSGSAILESEKLIVR
jgi:PKD repeat protein